MTEIVAISTRRFSTLVQICQRACVNNIDYINNLGDELSFNLVKPILEGCNAEQLLRLEESSPHLQAETQELWKQLCYSVYPLAVDKYTLAQGDEPTTWRDSYFGLRELEARRLEEATTRLRSQRHEAEERKKEREVKITDRVPPSKRPRTGWGSNPMPKTLFQKTRSEASKLQKNMYHARILPPMPQNGRRYTVLPKDPNTTVEFLPPSKGSTRVTVNNVVKGRPVTPSTTPPSSALSRIPCAGHSPHLPPSGSHLLSSPSRHPPATVTLTGSPHRTTSAPATSPGPSPRPVNPPIQRKKDPMASLFVPKRRAQC